MRGEGYLRRRLIRDLRPSAGLMSHRWNRRMWEINEWPAKKQPLVVRIFLIGAEALMIFSLALCYLILFSLGFLVILLLAWIGFALV